MKEDKERIAQMIISHAALLISILALIHTR